MAENYLNTSVSDYNEVAVMLGYAFEFAQETLNKSAEVRKEYREKLGVPTLTREILVDIYVAANASDKRYKIKWIGADTTHTVIQYRGKEYKLTEKYYADTKTSVFYVSYNNENSTEKD